MGFDEEVRVYFSLSKPSVVKTRPGQGKLCALSWTCVIQLNDELAVAASALKTIEQSGWTQIMSPPLEYGGNLKAILPTLVAW